MGPGTNQVQSTVSDPEYLFPFETESLPLATSTSSEDWRFRLAHGTWIQCEGLWDVEGGMHSHSKKGGENRTVKETHSMPSERSLGKLTDSKAKFSIWGWKAIQKLLPRGQTTKESGHRAGVRLA